MRALRLAFVSLALATSLAAQTPARPPAAAAPVPNTLSFDVAGLADSRARLALEPLVFGRWTIGLAGSYTWNTDARVYYYGGGFAIPELPPVDCSDPRNLCSSTGPGGPYNAAPRYRAWSFDVGARFYPAALSLSDSRHRLMVYLGEFLGYQHRRVRVNQVCYYCPTILRGDTSFAPPQPPDTLPGPILPPYPTTDRVVRTLNGLEPGAELGVRLVPAPPVFIDVGGWFKIVTVDDPMQRLRPGDLDARLVIAVGVGW